MTEPNGHVCPECTAPRTGDGTPSCACTRRASEALRDTRTAEAAAAEDFDPLRIRPYVELGGGGAGGAEEPPVDAAAQTMRLGRVTGPMPVPVPVPSEESVGLFRVEPAADPVPDGAMGPADGPPRRRRRTALLAATGAVVAVAAVAGFVSGVFSYDAPAREGALPDAVRASVPDPSSASASASSSASRPSESVAPVAPSRTRSSPSASASASPSPTSSASASSSATPSRSPSTAPATHSAAPDQAASPSNGHLSAALRRGDQGPEVTELQLRLRQLFVYNGRADGEYSRQVEDAVRRYQWARGITGDEQGVYGAATRASLESETREP